ncbi:hypothetical protein BH23GEM2_BH23GEM2_19160 [soil metagenome]
MNSGASPGDPIAFNRWVKATTLGWLMGLVPVIVLAVAWDQNGAAKKRLNATARVDYGMS